MRIRNTTKVDLAVGLLVIRPGKAVEIANWSRVKGADAVMALVRAGALVEEPAEKPKTLRKRKSDKAIIAEPDQAPE